VFSDTKPNSINVCSNPAYITNNCNTYRGRDIIAPVAAHCANGTPVNSFGPQNRDLSSIPFPEILESKESITAEVLYIDRFGNIITAIENQRISNYTMKELTLEINGERIQMSVVTNYNNTTNSNPLIYQGSSGYVEIAFNGSNAAAYFKVKSRDKLTVYFK
jgi:S-adenosylmethionine hydrolase